MPFPKVLSAARILCFVNGRLYGLVSGVRFTISTPRRELETIDSVLPFELMPTRSRTRGTVQVHRTAGDAGAEGAGMAGTAQLMARERYFSLLLVDRLTDLTIFRADYCSTTDQDWDVRVKNLMGGTLNFAALVASNEFGSPI